jgi:hypothetical protein
MCDFDQKFMWISLFTYLYFLWAGSTLFTCQTRLIFSCFHHAHHPEFSQTRLTFHPSMTTIFPLVLDLLILFSFIFFVICYFTILCFFSIFFLVTSILFFLPSFFQFNGVLFDLWVLGGSRDSWHTMGWAIHNFLVWIYTRKTHPIQTVIRSNHNPTKPKL